MAKRVEMADLTGEQAERLGARYAQRGAKDILISPQPDGRYTLSFLPGDPDFPTEDDTATGRREHKDKHFRTEEEPDEEPEEEDSDLPGDPDLDT